MTIRTEQAVKHLQDIRDETATKIDLLPPLMRERSSLNRTRDALDLAIEALMEKAERENPKLLAMDELKKMNGETVWVVELDSWAIVSVEKEGQWAGIPFVYTVINGVKFEWNAERRELDCYRHKPKGG